jgi:hypothetical protein
MNTHQINMTATQRVKAPLFASTWLALFLLLRDEFSARQNS